MMKTYKISEPFFDANILLIIGLRDEANKYIEKKYGIKDILKWEYSAQHTVVENKNNRMVLMILWIEKFDWKISEQVTLAHEIVHLSHCILKDRNILLCQETEEVYAYLFHNIMAEVWNCLKFLHPKIKRRKK